MINFKVFHLPDCSYTSFTMSNQTTFDMDLVLVRGSKKRLKIILSMELLMNSTLILWSGMRMN